MPDFSMNVQYPQQQQMSLADMLKLAGGAQAYQQAQQLNPVQLETARLAQQKAQQEVNQAQQLNPIAVKKAGEELTSAQEVAKQNLIKTLQDTQTQKANQFNALAGAQVSLINNPLVIKAEKTPESLSHIERLQLGNLVAQNVLNTAHAKGISEKEAMDQVNPMIEKILSDPSSTRQELKQLHIQTLDNASRTSALTPSGIAVNYGSGGQTTSTNPFGGTPQGQAIPGTQYTQGLAPSVQTGATQAPFVMSGQAGGVNQPNMQRPMGQTQGQPPLPPGMPLGQPQGQSSAPNSMVNQFAERGGIQISPGENYNSYRNRVERLGSLPKIANQAMNLGNQDSVPNQEYTNDKILKLLEKKNLEIGPIQNAIANKTGGIGLTSDQQEVIKYLEQRIRQESSRSNQDENSQRKAYGSFGTSKDALLDILYNDKGSLASQRLYHQGILKNQGNPNQPNLSNINNFENKFVQLNTDPNVTHLLGVIGTKSLNELSPLDVQHLKKSFGNMSQKQIENLFDKKAQLEALARGEK